MTVTVTLKFVNTRDAKAALDKLEDAAMEGEIAEPFDVQTDANIDLTDIESIEW